MSSRLLVLAMSLALIGACAFGQDSGRADADAGTALPDASSAPPDAPALPPDPQPDAGPTAAHAQIVASGHSSCALLSNGSVRCWGMAHVGQLGYGNTDDVGDDETPASAGDVDIGGPVKQLAAGDVHMCALLESGAVRCWGTGWYGRLGHGNVEDIGDNETPASAGDVPVGGAAIQISAGYHHSCAVLASGSLRCWGYGRYGSLGYGNTSNVGDDETPELVGDVPIGGPVMQVAAGYWHTCALLTSGHVRCFGWGSRGQLGYGNTEDVGDNETPAVVGDVDVGGTVVKLAAGYYHTCALLDTGAIRCWGRGSYGRLGYGNTDDIGDDETPASAGNVDVGGPAVDIAAGLHHTCALLQTGMIRCWGRGLNGRLGYGNTDNIGDDELPASAGDVNLGLLGGDDVPDQVIGVAAGHSHTCAQLQSSVVCWGRADAGQLGYGNTDQIGDDEAPASAGVVPVQ